MKRVLFNYDFIDKHTGETRKAGTFGEMTEERVKEVKEVNPNFVTVISDVEAPAETKKTVEAPKKKANTKK